MKKMTVLLNMLILCFATNVYSYTFETVDYNNSPRTTPTGINDSDMIAGYIFTCDPCSYSGGKFGFIYDGVNFTLLTHPSSVERTYTHDINNSNVTVGAYVSAVTSLMTGYYYDGSDYFDLSYPGSSSILPQGINNDLKIVGYWYDDSFGYRAFLYNPNNTSYTAIDYPGAIGTFANDINNNNVIVGHYRASDQRLHPFIYDGVNFESYEHPDAAYTVFEGINDEGIIVGHYFDVDSSVHGFIYKNGNFIDLDYPGAVGTYALGINNSGKIVGHFNDGNKWTGFIATPEPNAPHAISQVLQDLSNTINTFDSGVFKNAKNKNALTNKINAVLDQVDQGLYQEALDKLRNDILAKTDGCAESGPTNRTFDRNDWILSCPEQDQVYPLINEAISSLEELLAQ